MSYCGTMSKTMVCTCLSPHSGSLMYLKKQTHNASDQRPICDHYQPINDTVTYTSELI